MNYHELIKQTKQSLIMAKVPSPEHDSIALLLHILNIQLGDLPFILYQKVEPNIIHEYNTLVKQRLTRVPLQHIIGFQNFYGYDLRVNADVLIPRPETEILCEQVIKIVGDKNLKILDLCTGSGAIAIAIKLNCKNTQVVCSDISEKALEIARLNASHNLADIEFYQSDLFNAFKQKKFDAIVSNPPYIQSDYCKYLQQEVLFDPIIALDGGIRGLTIIERIILDAPNHLNKNGFLFMEIGENQGYEVKRLMQYDFKNIKLIKDLCKKNRFIYGELKE